MKYQMNAPAIAKMLCILSATVKINEYISNTVALQI